VVEVSFVAFQRTLPSEQLLIVGNTERLGKWQPENAVPLVKERDGCTHKCVVGVNSYEPRTVEYKYLLVDHNIPGHVKWEQGNNRVVNLLDPDQLQTRDYSFEQGDSGWIPYEPREQFLVLDDSEEEPSNSADEEEKSAQSKKDDRNDESGRSPDTQMNQNGFRGGSTQGPDLQHKNKLLQSQDVLVIGLEQRGESVQTDGQEGCEQTRHGSENGGNDSPPHSMFWKSEGLEQPSNVEGGESRAWSLDDDRYTSARADRKDGPVGSSGEGPEESSKVPLMSTSNNRNCIPRRASEVNLSDGLELYRSRALPLWVLWRQERGSETGSNASRSPKDKTPLLPGESTCEATSDKSVNAREKKRSSEGRRAGGRVPFWMLA